MNEYLGGFILGLVQGLTEFLPVSSSGHLALLEAFGVGEENVFFNLALHLATLLAVLVSLRKSVWEAVRHPTSPKTLFILVASVPTACMAAAVRYLVPTSASFLPFCFITTAVILLLPSVISRPQWSFGDKGMVKRALITGLAQGVACFNGISRSGATTSAMCLVGLEPAESAETSFLLSIPVIVGSSAVELIGGGAAGINWGSLLIGAVTAFLVGLAAIRAFLKIMKKRKLWIFSIYTFLLGIVSFALLF